MDIEAIINKFGGAYTADDNTFKMGIDQRFTTHIAERFKGRTVLETCTGAGFTTIALAEKAEHIFTIEVNSLHQQQAIRNIEKAGLTSKVTFIPGDILDSKILDALPDIESAFLDPDWADTRPEHQYRFINYPTQPPADLLLSKILEITRNVAIVLPPFIDVQEFEELPQHELERLYFGKTPELFCLYFGELKKSTDETYFRITT